MTILNRRKLLLNSLAATALGALVFKPAGADNGGASTPIAKQYKAVFQVSDEDPKKWHLTFGNVANLQRDVGSQNVVIEVVAFGPGIAMFKSGSEAAEQIAEAAQAGVTLSACENSMRGHNWKHEDMLSQVGYVPSGVAAVVKRQAAGYAYVRA